MAKETRPENQSTRTYIFKTCENKKKGKVCGNPQAFRRAFAGGRVLCNDCAREYLTKLLSKIVILIVLIFIGYAMYDRKSANLVDEPTALPVDTTAIETVATN